jgi:cysteine synthase A
MNRLYNNILETIGNTPIVKLNKIGPQHVNMYVKVESFNPMGSVKDRLAQGVIEAAEKSGALKPGQTVIEATSGNTGIGLAMVCAQKGYPLVVTMAENFSVERRKLMRFLGAKVVLTPAELMGSGMLAKATELAEKHGWFLCRQFENEANADVHSQTTAPEILDAFAENKLDYWVSGYGTGGTLKGVARVLKEQSPDTRVIVCEPDNSQLLSSGVTQARDKQGAPAESHPGFRPHLMQGWTPDFISKLTEDTVNAHLVDGTVPINGNDAIELSKRLAKEEGIFVGISAGATLSGALQVAEKAPEGSNILCMLPDTGERYLSTPLFFDIEEEMTKEEMDISCSSPYAQFDVQSSSDDEEEEEAPVEVTAEVKQLVDEIINDRQQPVTMFALEWCEFCWSVRKLFARLGIDYRSVDIDSVEYQKDDLGGQIKEELTSRTGFVTIPQIFVGGEFIGGCTDTFDLFKEGKLQEMLDKNGIGFNKEDSLDPYSLLPSWLHSR